MNEAYQKALKKLRELAKPKIYEAINEGNYDEASAYYSILNSYPKKRPVHAQIVFMSECLKEEAKRNRGTLGAVQNNTRICIERWKQLTDDDKIKYKAMARLRNKIIGVDWKPN
jgi:hypothetical protein